ncbi:kxDL motif-containing protein CG10681 [Diaphorina citri]|uniref:KxDL motif-containing protein CG10681 n=1 Tax=Diaphorina citri TaxID=121845 RepID=A0A1S3D8C7_DIACI|nr:kxDL motif-containing protein CG10681 [Diaphorina citri]
MALFPLPSGRNSPDVPSNIPSGSQILERLQKFEKTNEMLANCNTLSSNRMKTAAPEFKKNTKLIIEMKKDFEYIFKKINGLKVKLQNQYPQAFAAVHEIQKKNMENEEMPEEIVEVEAKDSTQLEGDVKVPQSGKVSIAQSASSTNVNKSNDSSPYSSDNG